VSEAWSQHGVIFGQSRTEIVDGVWKFDEDDWLLIGLLQDPIYCAELLFQDPNNRAYGGCYHVMDYQYPLFRHTENYEGKPCARSVGKTESMKADAVSHVFRRQGESMLITAPELIHLLPLCDAIEDRLRDTRLTREFLDTRNQKTGFTHRPFQADFLDGTKIVGRIPKLTGTGVKGQHQPDLRIEEGQDYPEKGWIEVHETVIKDHVDRNGNPDFTYIFYGVHSGARDGRFYQLSNSGEFKITQITAIMRPGWGPDEKARAAAIYGGTQAPDYRRNILGEAGGHSSAFFVTARLTACMDQDRESTYNTVEWKRQRLMSEEVDQMLGDMEGVGAKERLDQTHELLSSILDLPDLSGVQQIYAGADIGLVNDPTVITLFAIQPDAKKRLRMKLVRMFHLWRFREQMIRQVFYVIGWKYGIRLRGFGMDVTGLGLPIFQAIGDDERAPKHLLDVARGYVFNAKLPIGVDKSLVGRDSSGNLRDHLGNMVEVEVDPFTKEERYIIRMTMIEASTRYLREWVDSLFFMIPFDTEIFSDMQGETEQRVKAMAGMKKKPNAFHILDAMRAFAMVYKAKDIEAQIAQPDHGPVLARAVDLSTSSGLIPAVT
jgi:hypothetical protein